MKKQERLVKEIKRLSDSIKKKNISLKMGINQKSDFLESTFKPIVQPLKDISRKLNITGNLTEGDILMPVKKENVLKAKEYDENSTVTDISESEGPTESDKDQEQEDETDYEDAEMPGLVSTESKTMPQGGESNLSILGRDISSHGELFRKYVLKMLHGAQSNRRYHVYGARLEKNGLMVGNKELKVDDSDNIIINNKTYNGTPGLFELLFKKIPVRYTNRDLKAFKEICLATNTHKKNYSTTSTVHRSSTQKYKNIISKLFSAKAVGKGIVFKNAKQPNIIYYRDINKLVDRMKLLHEAHQVGHSGVSNEIVALTEELRLRGYIN